MDKIIIDLKNPDINHFNDAIMFKIERGSRVYGTNLPSSDYDYLIIVRNNVEFKNEDNDDRSDHRIKNYKFNEMSPQPDFNDNFIYDADGQIVRIRDFRELMKEHNPLAVEAVYMDKILGLFFALDRWKLRQSFGKVASNSYVKAKKKMTVEKDRDIKCGVKSLFHSIRLLMFACQIAEHSELDDYSCANKYWNDIYDSYELMRVKGVSGEDMWKYYNSKYKSIYNELHSMMVQLCPRPIDA